MARVTIAPESVPTGLPLTAETVVWVDANATDFNRFAHTGAEIVLVYNANAGAQTVKFQSVAVNGRLDPLHNTAISIPAAGMRLFNFRGDGWKQTSGDDSGYVQVDGSHADVKFMVIRT